MREFYTNIELLMLFALAVSALPFAARAYKNGGLEKSWKRTMKITESIVSFSVIIFCVNLTEAQVVAGDGYKNNGEIYGYYLFYCLTWALGILIWIAAVLFWSFKEKTCKKFLIYFSILTAAAEIVILSGMVLVMLIKILEGIDSSDDRYYFYLISECFLLRMILAGHIAVVYLLIREDCSQRRISEKN